MQKNIDRPEYLQFLFDWKDEDVIKVVSGVRRCGKSTLFEMYKEQLLQNNIPSEQIISINFEEFDFDHLREATALYNYIQNKVEPEKNYYIFLDEIQNVQNFERVINSLHLKKNLDIYITGSNAYFLS